MVTNYMKVISRQIMGILCEASLKGGVKQYKYRANAVILVEFYNSLLQNWSRFALIT